MNSSREKGRRNRSSVLQSDLETRLSFYRVFSRQRFTEPLFIKRMHRSFQYTRISHFINAKTHRCPLFYELHKTLSLVFETIKKQKHLVTLLLSSPLVVETSVTVDDHWRIQTFR